MSSEGILLMVVAQVVGLTWWFSTIIFVILATIGFLVHRSKINALKHQKSELERLLLERSEVLTYARQSEKRAIEEAERANKKKSLLISQISHDIRTPMTTIMGMGSLLNETALNAEQQEYASTIVYSGENLLTQINDILIKDVLEFSKIESGSELEYKDFDLRTTVEEVLDIFAAKTAAAGIDLIYEIDPNVPAQLVGDGMRIRQILMNLIENAVKFTDQGEVFVGVKLIDLYTDNTLDLEFEVSDSGKGISAEKLVALTHDLSKGGVSLDTAEAAGVGLIVCKKLVSLMEGSIQVESTEEKGTSIKFSISLSKGLQALRAVKASEMVGLEGKKVLIVDDNAKLLNVLKSRLENWKFAVTAVQTAKEALEGVKTEAFDLVLSDFTLPQTDGIQLAREIKQQHPDVPLILLNKPGDETFRKTPELFASILNKPVHYHSLIEQISNALRKGKTRLAEQANKQKLSAEFALQYPISILVAEDNDMNQKLVVKVLNKLGYEPKITSNGKEVLEEVSNKYYDLILMDIQMPEMDGLEATKMIRLCLDAQPVIIAMTANTLQGDREECLRAGMDDYISKPVKLDELVNILEKWAVHGKEVY